VLGVRAGKGGGSHEPEREKKPKTALQNEHKAEEHCGNLPNKQVTKERQSFYRD
jgi:hypothetical protein